MLKHEIPVYRVYVVGMGNAPLAGGQGTVVKRTRGWPGRNQRAEERSGSIGFHLRRDYPSEIGSSAIDERSRSLPAAPRTRLCEHIAGRSFVQHRLPTNPSSHAFSSSPAPILRPHRARLRSRAVLHNSNSSTKGAEAVYA